MCLGIYFREYFLPLNSFRSIYYLEVKLLRKLYENHVGARHCRKPLGRRKGFNIFITVYLPILGLLYDVDKKVGIPKSRAFATKS